VQNNSLLTAFSPALQATLRSHLVSGERYPNNHMLNNRCHSS
jgi:transposase